MTEKTKKWNDEALATLNDVVEASGVVSAAAVEKAAETLGTSVRSVAAKLRQLGREVASMAKEKNPTFTEEESNELAAYVNAHAGQYTYKQIAENFAGGKFTAKQVQGKLLALELTASVKPAEKVEAVRQYSDAEEAKLISMIKAGKFIEEIAEALGKGMSSVRGKALSLTRSGAIDIIPAQRESHAKNVVDPVDALGDKIATMTVAEIAAKFDKTERGLKTLLTRRGLDCADYKGSVKKAKAEGKAAQTA